MWENTQAYWKENEQTRNLLKELITLVKVIANKNFSARNINNDYQKIRYMPDASSGKI